jgi:hypothetical protein
MKYNAFNYSFIIFLFFVFFLGMYIYAFQLYPSTKYFYAKENMDTQSEICPDILMKTDNKLVLYNSKMPKVDGVNPIFFNSLDEYKEYLEKQRSNGNICPVLYLQQENDTQGNDVYRIRDGPFKQNGGVQPIIVEDASRDNPPYNAGNYPGFDPYGLYNGVYTNIDAVHDSTEKKQTVSDNPMDTNWGGVQFTKQNIDNGKYDDNNIYKPNYITPQQTAVYPDLYKDVKYPNDNVNVFNYYVPNSLLDKNPPKQFSQ